MPLSIDFFDFIKKHEYFEGLTLVFSQKIQTMYVIVLLLSNHIKGKSIYASIELIITQVLIVHGMTQNGLFYSIQKTLKEQLHGDLKIKVILISSFIQIPVVQSKITHGELYMQEIKELPILQYPAQENHPFTVIPVLLQLKKHQQVVMSLTD